MSLKTGAAIAIVLHVRISWDEYVATKAVIPVLLHFAETILHDDTTGSFFGWPICAWISFDHARRDETVASIAPNGATQPVCAAHKLCADY